MFKMLMLFPGDGKTDHFLFCCLSLLPQFSKVIIVK